MNEKFLELTEEKQMRIIDAAMEVFGTNEYKHAVTDEIARKAGISKGLLFYYFKNKKSLYQYVYQYCLQLLVDTIDEAGVKNKTDFFEIMRFGADKKMELIANHAYIMEFCMKAYYMNDENIAEKITQDIQQKVNTMFTDYFSHIDLFKFKEGSKKQKKNWISMKLWKIMIAGKKCLNRWSIERSIYECDRNSPDYQRLWGSQRCI